MALQMTATGTAVYKSDEQDFFIELRGLKSEYSTRVIWWFISEGRPWRGRLKFFLFAFFSGESRRILNRFCLLDFLVDLLFAGSAVKIRPKEGDVYFDVVAVVDPVTREAQKLAPLLLVGYLW